MSKGEEKIAKILLSYYILFKREVILEGVKRKLPLRYDFGIYNNGELIALIEVLGAQHYKQVTAFLPTKADFTKLQEYDRIKISAALAREIPLYIIPFTEIDNIKSPSDIFLSKFIAKTKWHNDENNPYSSL